MLKAAGRLADSPLRQIPILTAVIAPIIAVSILNWVSGFV